MIKFYHHYKHVNEWFWPNFSPQEIACKGTGQLLVDYYSMDCLQRARSDLGKPFYINSAYRSEKHNAMIGGAPLSMHLTGQAFDISLRNIRHKESLINILELSGFTGFGINYRTFVHVDTGRIRKW